MIKNKIDYKLINLCLILIIFLILYITKDFIFLVLDIIKPIFLSLFISYIFNLYLKKLNKIFNKSISIIFFFITIFLFTFIIYILFGKIVEQISNVSNIIIIFIKEFILKYNLDLFKIYDKIDYLTIYIPKIFNNILNYISLLIITISSSIYIFIDFNKIKQFLKKLSFYDYLKTINDSLESYIYSFMLLALINVIEYLIAFKIIGHPNFLILGIISGILSLIPMFGGIITNSIAIITAFIINYKLFIRTLIGILILTIIDNYIISPIIYSKNNKIHPLIIIFSIYIGGKIMGIEGIVFSLPIMIIILTLYKKIKNI